MNGLYNNSLYSNNRNRKKTLIIDFDDTDDTHLGSGTEFKIDLREPFIIDKHSEIYLDHFLTFNCNLGDTHNHAAFALKINEFNINSGVASNTSSDKIDGAIIIPNDNNNISNYFGTVSHKAKKFNYICDINPIRLTSLSGKITDLNGDPIFHGTTTGNQFTYALVGIESWDTTSDTPRALNRGETITSISPASGPVADANVRILTDTLIDSSVIYFTTTSALVTTDWDTGNIDFVINAVSPYATYDFTLTRSGINPGMKLIGGNGRFTAEFSIVSRE